MSATSERLFTSREVSEVVRRRLAKEKLNATVILELLRNICERLDALEKGLIK